MTPPAATKPCRVPWPVCPDCLGSGLSMTGGRATCPHCYRSWAQAEVVPCPWPVAAELADGTGKRLTVCASHAAHPSGGDLKGSTLKPAPE